MLRSLFGFFGTKAISILLKTIYCGTGHDIGNIAQSTKNIVDHQTSAIDMIVCETTYNLCCVKNEVDIDAM